MASLGAKQMWPRRTTAEGRRWRTAASRQCKRHPDNFGAACAQCAKAARRKPGSTWHLDEMFVTLRGEAYLLWRAVDEHGAELDVHG
ncbi:IS element transposase [Caballeronia choica]|uniref:IS element transposase n=1 Tax=Caballeronia choica TaxID=326476 RepID=A0A158KI01_9BURK|nr:IS element transposase [Caballeronia choica]